MAVYKNRIDLHMHTKSSFDGNYTAEEMCASAVANGLSFIAITDHFDVDFFERHNLDVRQKTSYEGILSAREMFRDKIVLLRGIEMGQPTYDVALTEKSLARYEYDFVIGSIHNPRGMPDYGDFNYKEMTENEIYSALDNYFEEELALAKWNGFDTFAHLTYPMRYIVQAGRNEIELSRYDDIPKPPCPKTLPMMNLPANTVPGVRAKGYFSQLLCLEKPHRGQVYALGSIG